MATAAEKRKEAVRLMKSRAGKNTYTQGDNRNCFFGKPEGTNPGYSDCSSSVRACIKRAAGIDIGSNTSAQITNRAKGVVVEMANGKAYPTESLLKPGDCVYYKGNVAHAWGVGHVEMYIGSGKLMGHGSGIGPKEHNLVSYSKSRGAGRGYLCAIRWMLDDGSETIAPGNPSKLPPAPTLAHGILITGDTVNVRTGPSTDYEIVDTVKKGQVFARPEDTGWYPIVVDGRIVWVSNNLAKEV